MIPFDDLYRKAVEESGYTHDLYHIRLTGTSLDETLPTPYVIKRDGEPLSPEYVISALQQLADDRRAGGWISVADALPPSDEDTDVIIRYVDTDNSAHYALAEYWGAGIQWLLRGSGWLPSWNRVTHWMAWSPPPQ